MPHQNENVYNVLLRFTNIIRELCQRGLDKRRPIPHLNLETVVADLLREHGLEPDFEPQFAACINAMSQDDAIGQILVLERTSGALLMRHIAASELTDSVTDHFEMVIFDGGNTRGDKWKHVFFPRQHGHCFMHEH